MHSDSSCPTRWRPEVSGETTLEVQRHEVVDQHHLHQFLVEQPQVREQRGLLSPFHGSRECREVRFEVLLVRKKPFLRNQKRLRGALLFGDEVGNKLLEKGAGARTVHEFPGHGLEKDFPDHSPRVASGARARVLCEELREVHLAEREAHAFAGLVEEVRGQQRRVEEVQLCAREVLLEVLRQEVLEVLLADRLLLFGH